MYACSEGKGRGGRGFVLYLVLAPNFYSGFSFSFDKPVDWPAPLRPATSHKPVHARSAVRPTGRPWVSRQVGKRWRRLGHLATGLLTTSRTACTKSVFTSGADHGRTAPSKFDHGHLSHFKEDTGEPSVPVQEFNPIAYTLTAGRRAREAREANPGRRPWPVCTVASGLTHSATWAVILWPMYANSHVFHTHSHSH